MAQAAIARTERVGTEHSAAARAGGERLLSPEHARHLRVSYRLIEPAADLVATLFFRRLRTIAPELQPFLNGSEEAQRRQLLTALLLAVASLDRFQDVLPALNLLGAKYRAMGVTEMHYGAVGEALLWTLKQSLGEDWTSETADAWTALCTVVAEVMTEPN